MNGRNPNLPERIFVRLKLAVLIGALAGCSDNISPSDVQFVVAAMPSQFKSLRMYHTAPDNVAPFGSSGSHAPVQLQQGCAAGYMRPEVATIDSTWRMAGFERNYLNTIDAENGALSGSARYFSSIALTQFVNWVRNSTGLSLGGERPSDVTFHPSAVRTASRSKDAAVLLSSITASRLSPAGTRSIASQPC
jgi:hypothetical protein